MSVRLAVIGSGFGLYGVMPAFQAIPECSVVGIAGRSSERMLDYCRQTSVDHFEDWREMLDRVRPGAIAVAVIPKHQPEIILSALDRGISVFAEKPLSTKLEEAAEMLARAKAKGVAHMVDFIFPEIPSWKAAKEALEQNRIGKVIQLSVTWNFLSYDLRNQVRSWKTDAGEGGGALSFFFSHVFYNLEFFMGRIQTVFCDLNCSSKSLNGGETVVNLIVKFENGCAGNVVLDCSSIAPNRHAWEFHGESGALVLENKTRSFSQGFDLFHYGESGNVEPVAVGTLDFAPNSDERVPLVTSLGKRFIHWCDGKGVAKPDFEDGYRVQRLIDLSRKSFERGERLFVSV